MKICIASDSTLDLSKELLDEFNVKTIGFPILLGEKVEYDGQIDPLAIFDYVDKTGVLPKTSAINVEVLKDFFKELLKESDEVIYFSLSDGISSVYQNALAAAKEVGHIHVIDSASLSTGVGLQVINAAKLVKEGKSLEEILENIEKRKPFVQASFVVATLDYLYKGGRCSALAKFGAQLFRIRPQIVLSEGKMKPGKKYMGKQVGCVQNYVKDTLAEFDNPDLSLVFITHSHATPEMVEIAKKALIERGFERIEETFAGATISSHCGPKTIGILYFNDGGNK